MLSLCATPIGNCRVPLVLYIAIRAPTIHEPAPIHSHLILGISCAPSLAIFIPRSLTPCATCLRNICSYRVPLQFCCQFCPRFRLQFSPQHVLKLWICNLDSTLMESTVAPNAIQKPSSEEGPTFCSNDPLHSRRRLREL